MNRFDASVAGTVLDDPTPNVDSGDHTVARGDDLVGHIFVGRYQIEKQIASGTMGRVYLGTQLRLERPVAVKILKQWGNAIDPRFAKRFCREASIASQLAHPNIVSIYDYGETDDRRLFMVMEYLEGTPLHELIREHAPFTAERALAIAIQIARALRKAHAAGVVHRDLKPANVVVKTDEEGFDLVKVLDFGLVKLFAPDESPVTAPDDDDHLTRPGNMVGTPDYVSPEQALGDQVDGRTDIYSLGVLMFQMIAGQLPFKGSSILEMVKQHLNMPVPWIAEIAPGVECPEAIELIIRKAMSKHRDERFSSMDDMLAALKSAWRNVTDESYGTETSQASLLPDVFIPPASTSAELMYSRGMPLDPSEVSRPAGSEMPFAHDRSQAGFTVLIAAAFLSIALVAGAFAWRSYERASMPTPIAVEVEPSREVRAAPAPASWAPRTAAGLNGDEPGRSSRPAVVAPVVVEEAKLPEGDAAVVQDVQDAQEDEEPAPARAKKAVKRAKKSRVYKDNPF